MDQDTHDLRQQVLAKLPESERKRIGLGYRLFKLRKNTGFRGATWFEKGEIGLGRVRPGGSIETYSFQPIMKDGKYVKGIPDPIGACSLPNANAIKWLEPDPMVILEARPDGKYYVSDGQWIEDRKLATQIPFGEATKIAHRAVVPKGTKIVAIDPNKETPC